MQKRIGSIINRPFNNALMIKKVCHTAPVFTRVDSGGYPNSVKKVDSRFHGNDDQRPTCTFSTGCQKDVRNGG
jgi:hypothetical protein